MADFRTHITVSSLLGVGYGFALVHSGLEWTHALLATGLCGIAGMLPDLDSPTGKPVHELFGIVGAVGPILLLQRFRDFGANPEGAILLAAVLYFAIRFGAPWILGRCTVHRGMFHSLPAALIAAELTFLAHRAPDGDWPLALPFGVLIGFLSHLVLDEIYAIDMHGVVPRLNKAAGSAFKLFSKSLPATAGAWLVLGALTYLAGIKVGYFDPIQIRIQGLGLQAFLAR